VQWEVEGESGAASAPAEQELSTLPSAAHPLGERRRLFPGQAAPVVGREAELRQLSGYWRRARSGARQLVFVTGEPGIGKTTLVERFLAQVAAPGETPGAEQAAWLGRGQCIEQYGAGEAYMPLLEALGRLCREPGGERLIALLHQHAPTWLVQMPTVVNASEWETLQRKVQGATRERMLREMAEALDAITAERPLILWLEDLHWSDPSTLELLALLARRREPARLLIIGTYRPVDVIVQEHPLKAVKQELQLHGQCAELAVRLLSEEHIAQYLAARVQVPSSTPAGEGQGEGHSSIVLTGLAHTIHQRTEGNPLFLVTVVDELLVRRKIDSSVIEVSTPATIRGMIEQQFDRLSPEEQRVVEVASVVGMEFSAAAVAAGAETSVHVIEERCAALARRGQFFQVKGTAEWPDGTIATRYTFLHALYQEVTYERIPAGRRVNLHQRIGERREAAYGNQAAEIAVELAVHFERGRDYPRAVRYLQRAGENALQRNAYQEAVALLARALKLLVALPSTLERNQQELRLQMILGASQQAIMGQANPEVEKTFARAQELCQVIGATPELFPVLWGLFRFYFARADLRTAHKLARQFLSLAQNVNDPALLMEAHRGLASVLFQFGELPFAKEHFEQAIVLYDPQRHRTHASLYGQDPGVVCLSYLEHVLWYLGYPEQAFKRTHEALSLAQEVSHPLSLALARLYASITHQLRREEQLTEQHAVAAIEICTEREFPFWLTMATIQRGWALAEQGAKEGITQMYQGLAAQRATGAGIGRTRFLALLVEGYRKGGQIEEALAIVSEALEVGYRTGERNCEAELYRLKGELLLAQEIKSQKSKGKNQKAKIPSPQSLTLSPQAEAEAYFLKAIDIARHQQAKSWELRASTSLARLWQSQGKKKEAHKLLTEIYGWFTEGFDTKDLQEAKALIEEVSY